MTLSTHEPTVTSSDEDVSRRLLDSAAAVRRRVRELLRICFEDLRLRRVTANAFAANEASWRLMERVGMRREGFSVADSLHRDLGWVDGVLYALLADEWSADR